MLGVSSLIGYTKGIHQSDQGDIPGYYEDLEAIKKIRSQINQLDFPNEVYRDDN